MAEKDEVINIDIDKLKADFKKFAKLYAEDTKRAKESKKEVEK